MTPSKDFYTISETQYRAQHGVIAGWIITVLIPHKCVRRGGMDTEAWGPECRIHKKQCVGMCVCDLMALGGRDRRMPRSSLAFDLSEVFSVVDKRPLKKHAGWSYHKHRQTNTQGLQKSKLNSLQFRCCLVVLVMYTPAVWLQVWMTRCRQGIPLTRGYFSFASVTKSFFWHEKQCVWGVLVVVYFILFLSGRMEIPTYQELERKIGRAPGTHLIQYVKFKTRRVESWWVFGFYRKGVCLINRIVGMYGNTPVQTRHKAHD